MNTAKLVVMLVLILLVGIFAGALGTRIYLRHELQASQADRHNSEEKIKRIVARLTGDLKLDANQQAEVRKIVTATEARATATKVSYEPELKRIYDRSFDLMGEKLSIEQKAKLQKRHERFSARYNALYFASLHTAQSVSPDMESMSRHLGLDDAQRSRIIAILQDQRSSEDSIIDKYQKMQLPDLTAVDRDIAEIRTASMKNISRVMTREQFEHFKKDIAVY